MASSLNASKWADSAKDHPVWVMYFHCPKDQAPDGRQRTYVAVSVDGKKFHMHSRNEDHHVGHPYAYVQPAERGSGYTYFSTSRRSDTSKASVARTTGNGLSEASCDSNKANHKNYGNDTSWEIRSQNIKYLENDSHIHHTAVVMHNDRATVLFR